MLEYMAYRKYKKNKTEKEAKKELERQQLEGKGSEPDYESDEHEQNGRSTKKQGKLPSSTPQPLLDQDDEAFIESLLNDPRYEGPPPPLPMRSGTATPQLDYDDSDSSTRRQKPRRTETGGSVASGPSVAPEAPSTKTKTKTMEKDPEEKKKSRNPIYMLLNRKDTDKDKQLTKPRKDPAAVVEPDEAERERDDLSRVLDDLNLGATKNNKAFALSPDNNELVRKFTLVLKDLVNGVPTAVDDLRNLIDDRDGTLKRNYDKLPDSMKKLVSQLPDKVQNHMGPELMAAAAASQGIKTDPNAKGKAGMKDTAKNLFMPKNLNDIVTKPSAIIGMLKAIVSFLKLRWPAFIGVNVVWSIAIFLLLLVLWYCHKRGREVRLEREASESAIDGSGRVEELPDDLMLEGPPSRGSSYRADSYHRGESRRYHSRSGRSSPDYDYSPVEDSPPRRRRTHK